MSSHFDYTTLAGGFGHKLKDGKLVMIASEIGQKLGNSVELRRYMGEWTRPDAICVKRYVINAQLVESFPVVFEEEVNVFLTGLDPSFVQRRIDIPIPSFIPKIQSITGGDIQLFREIDLEETTGLSNQALKLIASSILSFYESTINPVSNSTEAQMG